jgi:cytochrome c biogenesis protein CcdA
MADLALYAAVATLGLVHGAEPGHGWPVAAAYALDREHRLASGLLASVVIGVGHLVSSIAVVTAFLLVADWVGVADLGWVRYVAGVLLIALGVREYLSGGRSHDHGGDGHDHDHADEDRAGPAPTESVLSATAASGPALGETDGETTHAHGAGEHGHGHDHGHAHSHALSADDPRGLWGLASSAFVLGFAHEEEFEILGFCTGATDQCLPLMLAYAAAVVLALVALTLLLVAGFERYEERVGRWAEHFPTISAAVLVLMGLGFIAGVL